jgi:WD40 repeat protein
MTPGAHPLEKLARVLWPEFTTRGRATSIASLQEDLNAPSKQGLQLLIELLLNNETSTVVLYIDQFEELFTQTLAEAERVQFIEILQAVWKEPASSLFTILSLRADFYDRPMHYPELFRRIEQARVPILMLDSRDLQHIIRKPAALPDVQLQFEDDLVGELLADMRGQSGALPLLQFTLYRLFQQRQARTLTLAAYHEMGDVQGALVQHAEATFAHLPDEEHRRLAKALFLQLIDMGSLDQYPTRRRVIPGELVMNEATRVVIQHIASRFITARLLTAAEKQEGVVSLEVSHEALIRHWPRLAEWLREAYDDLYVQRRVREDAAQWNRLGRLTARLYSGDRLTEARTWREHALPSYEEEAFLAASEQLEKQAIQVHRRRVHRRNILISIAATIGVLSSSIVLWRLLNPIPPVVLTPPLVQTSTLGGHTDAVVDISWAPDGRWLATASDDRTGRIWEAASGGPLYTLEGHTGSVLRVVWAPDGRWLATASIDRTARVWEAASGKLLHTLRSHTGVVVSVVWAPDGRWLATASQDNTAAIWEAASGRLLHILHDHTDVVWSVAWAPDGRWLATASADKSTRIWETTSGRLIRTLKGHTGSVSNVAWAPDGRWLTTASEDNTVCVWELTSGQLLYTLRGHTEGVNSVLWAPDGRWLATSSADGTARIWEASSGKPLHILQGHTRAVNSVAWAPDGHWLATASTDWTARIWEASSGRPLHILHGHTSVVFRVAWAPNGQWLATASEDWTAHIWGSGR